MKKIKLFKLTLISSLVFLTACSNKEAKIKTNTTTQQLSVYNIIGISEPQKELVHFTLKEDSPQIETYKEYISEDIEVISYRTEPPIFHYDTINQIELNAKSFLGIPYVWGATGPSKFDCSGFTQWVYRDVGINIPRVSKDQARVGQYIQYQNLQRGDMVFFDTKKRRAGKVTHVGIYLGSGDFIHASSAGKQVVIYNFNEKSFYKKRFLWGRRVTNNHFHYASN
jgi:hypothetical protein